MTDGPIVIGWVRRLLRSMPPPTQNDEPIDRMMSAVDELNVAWNEMADRSYRPWVQWKERRVVIIRYDGSSTIVYPPEAVDDE